MLPCLTMRMKQIFVAALAAFAFATCGYHLAGKVVSLPGGGRELMVPLMKNQTLEAGLEDLMTQELRGQLLSDGRVQVRSSAPVELRGTLTRLDRTPVSFSNLGRVNVERVQVTAEFRLVRRSDGQVLWQSGELSADEEYPAEEDPLVTERAREQALHEVAEDLCEGAIELLLGDF